MCVYIYIRAPRRRRRLAAFESPSSRVHSEYRCTYIILFLCLSLSLSLSLSSSVRTCVHGHRPVRTGQKHWESFFFSEL